MRKLFLLIITLISSISANAYTWASIGEGYYEDPTWYVTGTDDPIFANVLVEECIDVPGYYRLFAHMMRDKPYIYVHCENREKVYVEPYSNTNTKDVEIAVYHRCPENGWDTSAYYGTLENNEVIIPGKYFSYYDGSSWTTCNSNRRFCFRLPSESDVSKVSGVSGMLLKLHGCLQKLFWRLLRFETLSGAEIFKIAS